ncbi:TRAP-type C4-dicarboxylate transport system permease small subunit [Palleronia aestuarii]|uniref:TRAP transporter small permease protein n=1 Tax=Palleronia aestuarii TaxID=568105 RepID=A0A2W7NA86_9RHOB|nr:TRAP transporter small permease subunit [Palleronia aestuarii]PZX17161.1 TRAP-type C4-dicarboxylate transport system permease small subunit [Palleronia aestuarii]
MTPYEIVPEGPLQRALNLADRLNWSLGGAFLWLSNLCLLAMLALTAATIVLRPLSLAQYWMWPWTMVFFIWLSFFGFFALYARLKDVRVDFVAGLFGPRGMAITRIVSDAATLFVTGILLSQLPMVIDTSRGVYNGAILPDGFELPRLALSIPLFVSTALIALNALLDLAKMAAGLPENLAESHPEI